MVSAIVLTAEMNGAAIWYAHQDAAVPRLLSFYPFTATRPPDATFHAAALQAEQLRRDALDHGEQYAALRRFEQQ